MEVVDPLLPQVVEGDFVSDDKVAAEERCLIQKSGVVVRGGALREGQLNNQQQLAGETDSEVQNKDPEEAGLGEQV